MAQISPDHSALAASASSSVFHLAVKVYLRKGESRHLLRLFQSMSGIVKLQFVNSFRDGAQQIGSTSTSA